MMDVCGNIGPAGFVCYLPKGHTGRCCGQKIYSGLVPGLQEYLEHGEPIACTGTINSQATLHEEYIARHPHLGPEPVGPANKICPICRRPL